MMRTNNLCALLRKKKPGHKAECLFTLQNATPPEKNTTPGTLFVQEIAPPPPTGGALRVSNLLLHMFDFIGGGTLFGGLLYLRG